MTSLQALDRRSREIFKTIVEAYLETGEPVGSRTISKRGVDLSPASIRNVMADLVSLGLLDAPHISAGRRPSHAGLPYWYVLSTTVTPDTSSGSGGDSDSDDTGE